MTFEYIAGFFDADGSILLARPSKRETRKLTVTLTNADLSNLEAIKKFLNAGTIVKYPKREEHHRQAYDLRFVGSTAERLMNGISPYICNTKKIDRWNVYRYDFRPLKKRNGKYTDEEKEQLEAVYEKFVNVK